MEKTGGFCGQPLEVDAGLKESVVEGFHMNDAGIYGEAMVSGGKGQTECLLICWFVRQDEACACITDIAYLIRSGIELDRTVCMSNLHGIPPCQPAVKTSGHSMVIFPDAAGNLMRSMRRTISPSSSGLFKSDETT